MNTLIVVQTQSLALAMRRHLAKDVYCVGYGDAINGRQFEKIIVLHRPNTANEIAWQKKLRCRVAPNGIFLEGELE